MKGNASGFSIVISIIVIVIAPILFALSLTLLNFISDLFQLISKTQNSFISISAIPPEFISYLVTFSYSMIILIAISAGLIVASLKNEKAHDFIKYVPFNVTIGLLLFNLARSGMDSFFNNFI